jgi:hypothetical protein
MRLRHGLGQRHKPDCTLYLIAEWILGKPVGLDGAMEEGIDDGERLESIILRSATLMTPPNVGCVAAVIGRPS